MDSRPGDEMLLPAVAERDMGAFRTLYERHAGWLAIRLARRCNDRDLSCEQCRGRVNAAAGVIDFAAVWDRTRDAVEVPRPSLRTIAVLALALPVVLLFGLVVPGEAPFAWLLPAVGFVAVVLAASTWVSPLRAAIAVSSVWLGLVWLLAARAGSPDAVLQARAQAGFLVLAAASLVIFLLRRRWLRQLRPWR